MTASASPTRLGPLGHARAILVLGLPLIGSHVAQYAITLTDALMLGWYDVQALAGEVLGGSLYVLVFIAGSGFAFAVMPMVAHAAAAGEERQVRRVTRMGIWLSLGYGALLLPLLLSGEAVFRALGQEPGVAGVAGAYLRIDGWALLPALVVMVLKSYLSALERTKVVFWVTLAAVPLNAFLNYLLIFGHWGLPEMGVQGAAVASVAVMTASMLLLVGYALRAMPEHELLSRFWRPDPEALARVFQLGWPISLTLLSEVGLFSASSVMMGWLGTIPLAAHGIALQVASVTFMVHLGLSNAATIRAGNAMGRRDGVALRRGARVVIGLSMAAALLTVSVFLLFPETLIGAFLDPGDPDRAAVMAIGTGLLAAAALFQVADAGQVMALGLLRGVQDTRVPMVMAAVSYWGLGLPGSYLLGFVWGWGGVGVWLGLALGLAAAAALLMTRFWRRAPGYA